MQTELDQIKSTITISLGTKNRLRKLKGSHSYEAYINYLVRSQNNQLIQSDNTIELQRFMRKTGLYSFDRYKIIFEYNQFNNSSNFFFDIRITAVRENGSIIPLEQFLLKFSSEQDLLKQEYALYFELLQDAIRKEIDPAFRHNGRFEDYFSWENEFKLLNLFKMCFEEDVMDKLKSYKQGEGAF